MDDGKSAGVADDVMDMTISSGGREVKCNMDILQKAADNAKAELDALEYLGGEVENYFARKITKIKYKSQTERVEIMYYVKRLEIGPLAIDEYRIVCNDKPLPEFVYALKKLALHVVDMCELPEVDKKNIEVTGVSFSYAAGPDHTMGASIIAQKSLIRSNTKLNLVTPHKPVEFYSGGEGDPHQLLDGTCVADLRFLLKQVQRYIDGERAQGTLFPAEAEKEKHETSPGVTVPAPAEGAPAEPPVIKYTPPRENAHGGGSAVGMTWVLPALLAGEKTCTRRTWTDDYAARFKKGDLVLLLGKDRRASGKVVARIRLTADPVKQHISEMLDTDYKAEGFEYMSNNGLTSNFPFGFSRAGFNNWKKIDRMYWVIRFEKVDVKKVFIYTPPRENAHGGGSAVGRGEAIDG
jgi:hypothetical protein